MGLSIIYLLQYIIQHFRKFQKESLILNSNKYFPQYLNKLFSDLCTNKSNSQMPTVYGKTFKYVLKFGVANPNIGWRNKWWRLSIIGTFRDNFLVRTSEFMKWNRIFDNYCGKHLRLYKVSIFKLADATWIILWRIFVSRNLWWYIFKLYMSI